MTLLTGFGGEENYTRVLLQHFEPRIEGALDFAPSHRVLLLRARSGVGLDIALGGLPFEESVIERSSFFARPGGVELRTCSAEDLIVLKAFADRGKDWLDVEGVMIRQTGRLDWAYYPDGGIDDNNWWKILAVGKAGARKDARSGLCPGEQHL